MLSLFVRFLNFSGCFLTFWLVFKLQNPAPKTPWLGKNRAPAPAQRSAGSRPNWLAALAFASSAIFATRSRTAGWFEARFAWSLLSLSLFRLNWCSSVTAFDPLPFFAHLYLHL